jgi:hypothetical protein
MVAFAYDTMNDKLLKQFVCASAIKHPVETGCWEENVPPFQAGGRGLE